MAKYGQIPNNYPTSSQVVAKIPLRLVRLVQPWSNKGPGRVEHHLCRHLPAPGTSRASRGTSRSVKAKQQPEGKTGHLEKRVGLIIIP